MTTIERALQLSSDGKHRTINDIRRTLSSEGYEAVHSHTNGSAIKQQLLARIKATAKPG